MANALIQALANAVLGSDLVVKAEAARAAEPLFLLRHAVELAALIVQEYADGEAHSANSADRGADPS